MVSTVPMRLPVEARDRLRHIAEAERKSVSSVVMEMIADREEQQFWADARAAAARLTPEDVEEMDKEQDLYDRSLADGLGEA